MSRGGLQWSRLLLLELRVIRGEFGLWGLLFVVLASVALSHASDPVYTGSIFLERIVSLALAPLFASVVTEDARNRMRDVVIAGPSPVRTQLRRLALTTTLALAVALVASVLWAPATQLTVSSALLTCVSPTLAIGYTTYALAAAQRREGEALTVVLLLWAALQATPVVAWFSQAPAAFSYLFPASSGMSVPLEANKVTVLAIGVVLASTGVRLAIRR